MTPNQQPSPAGNMLIAQSGGPTAVINQSLAGAVLEAQKHPQIGSIFGARNGIQGILTEDLVDLGQESEATLRAVARTPGSALGSIRKKPCEAECAAMLLILARYNIRYLFYIGGNDSAETLHILNEQAKQAGQELRCFHICKTIDNDLLQNDHTPGYGSAARFVALAFMGDNLDNAALGGVKINIIMGRSAGFLTAASALARQKPNDGPHLIYLPEHPFSTARFIREIQQVYNRLGRCQVAVSEGICDADGVPILVKVGASLDLDNHGNIQLSGTGALGDLLAKAVKTGTHIERVRADTFGYLQRSFAGCTSPVDADEAFQAGTEAVRIALTDDLDGSIAIQRCPGPDYAARFTRVPLEQVARKTRCMPTRYIAESGNDVTQLFIDYAAPLVGPLPQMARLTNQAAHRPD